MIEIKGVSKTYSIGKNNVVLALNNISFCLPNKGMVFITGASGSGKSTLLNLLGLLDLPDKGEIIIDGKSLNKFKKKEVDYYRNTYVGFVFQEYNLLDNFNVEKNIEIALNLQKKCREQIDKILELVGLQNFGKRKINELSGGQKQRVAIGRAIVKNPNIILADEPTGNLDYNNSEQIFNLLKKISQEKLVVVVTHNIEFANKYADRLIEIRDGNIIRDHLKREFSLEDYEKKAFSLIKSKLSFLNAISLSFSNLKRKKLKLLITTLLIAASLSMFGFFWLLTKFDIDRTHAETLIKENETRIEINKKIAGKNFTTSSSVITFTDEEVIEVDEFLKKDTIKVRKAVENNYYLTIPFASNLPMTDNKSYAYYELYPSYTLFLEYSQDRLNDLNLIGRIPTNSNEIIINKVLADYFIHNGLSVLETDKNGKIQQVDYIPTTYEEIINSNKKIAFGSSYLIVSGIIDEDMTKYDELKNTLSDEMQVNPTKLYEEFKTKYYSKLSEVIVPINFFETINLKPNNEISVELYKLAYTFENQKIYPMGNSVILDKKIKIYDGKEERNIESLASNEVIISSQLLDDLYDNEYSNRLMEYIKEEVENYNNKVLERQEEIERLEKEQENNPEFVFEYPKEIEEPDVNKLMKAFTKNYLNEKNIIGKSFLLEINDLYLRVQDEKTQNFKDFVIVGFIYEDVNNYFSDESILKDYMRGKSETTSVYFYENNLQELESIFKQFSNIEEKYVLKTLYSDTIKNVELVVKNVSIIALYFSIFSLLFSIILFIFFTLTSVNNNKRSIGILRALGAKISDIYKIFYLESFLMGLFAFIISSFVSYFSVIIGNNLISSNLFINVEPIIFRTDVILLLFIMVIVLTILSFTVPILRISKTKPIDVINNK